MRQGLVFFDDQSLGPVDLAARPSPAVEAIAIELAELGFVPSTRLSAHLNRLSSNALAELRAWMWPTLEAAWAMRGATPLFPSFPLGVPDDTHEWWVTTVLVHFLQGKDQPCLFCRRSGTTHVMDPCEHVVCDRCFDGSAVSACPVCGGKVAPNAFVQPVAARKPGKERVFRLLDVGEDLDAAAKKLVVDACARKQAMSPIDVEGLTAAVRDFGVRALPWLPATIAVRENMARVFGALLASVPVDQVLAFARPYLKTATDVLRLVAGMSGADVSLQAKEEWTRVTRDSDPRRWEPEVVGALRRDANPRAYRYVKVQQKRWEVMKLSRPVRRAVLTLLDAMPAERVPEDMLRHASLWRWVGEVLHPGDYAKQFPNAWRGFQIVRGELPFETFNARVTKAIAARDVATAITLLTERPGDFARRFDHLARIAPAGSRVLATFEALAPKLATPVLMTLWTHLPRRGSQQAGRVYFPKGATTSGVHAADARPPLPSDAITAGLCVIEAELLRRCAALPPVEVAIIDTQLRDVIVPFNERTAARGAVQLPRGSHVPIPPSKHMRLFLHWCQPEGGLRTDIDLSVAFYGVRWGAKDVCSFYSLKVPSATHSGDFTSAPFPDGASEYVDVDREAARAAGIRYAAMVVNNYSGLPFGKLDQGFAGVMLRDSLDGLHYDPRTVELRFDLSGENGTYVPLVVDLEEDRLHWLDAYDEGQLALNTAASSNRAIQTFAPSLIRYFASGVRPTMFQLAALHAAARASRTLLRAPDGTLTEIVRNSDDTRTYLSRIFTGHGTPGALPTMPAFAALFRGDLDLAPTSTVYALFRDRAFPYIAAASLLV